MSASMPSRGGIDIEDVIKQFEDAYAQASKDLGRFNLAIFGKTGVGKSTLINAVFSADVAKTGSGRPVTLKTEYFEHPSGFFGVYDSEGIEVGDEGNQILERFRQIIAEKRGRPIDEQIHVIWYCVRAGDLRFEDSQAMFIKELASEGLPIVFVLTQVQKRADEIHPEVCKLIESITDRALPLAPDNRLFCTMAIADEWGGWEEHGLQELLDATFRVAPDGVANALTAAQKIDFERKAAEARNYVRAAAASAAFAGATPIPFADAALLVPIQIGMMAKVGAIFGLGLKQGTLGTLAGAALTAGGVTTAGKYIVTSLVKFLPGGNIVAGGIRASVASTLTYAVGEAWIVVCAQLYKLGPEAAQMMPTDEIRALFMTEFKKRTGGKGGEERNAA
jgi:uncharacterized protein (DUF697 family)/GTP-binding protein EngB required for normal cell division